jgi:molybdenum cofactor cytidylyltransferase
MRDSPIKFGAVILAAGASVRMGQPKMLLPWNSTSVVGHIINIWSQTLLADQVAVVCSPAPSPVHSELDRLGFSMDDRIINSDPSRGMFSSIQTAAGWGGWKKDLSHFVLLLGDQPHLSESTLEAVLRRAKENAGSIVQPSFNNKPKHPVVLPAGEFRALAVRRCATLRDFLSERKTARIEVNDPGLDLDLDYPSEYEAARRLTRNLAKLDAAD